MKILVLHNTYQQPGGEDQVVERERAMLLSAGHTVSTYFRDNDNIGDSLAERIAAGSSAIWARDSYDAVGSLIKSEKPDVAHFHNTFPLISPSAYYACQHSGVPVIQTLHNYRLFCPASNLFRNGRICEECTDQGLWRAVQHRCYRGSRLGTAAVVAMLITHRVLKTFMRTINCFIAVSEFERRRVIAESFPQERVYVKPNFLDRDPGEQRSLGDYAIFVGRLTPEKGLKTLISALTKLRNQIPVVIVGDGPLRMDLERRVVEEQLSTVRFLGYLDKKTTLNMIKQARFLIFPSEWYETFGLTIIEAFACGVPVICSHLGAMKELVENGRTGLHTPPGDSEMLAAKIFWAWSHPEQMCEMGQAARLEYQAKYTVERNYQMLIDIYDRAMRIPALS